MPRPDRPQRSVCATVLIVLTAGASLFAAASRLVDIDASCPLFGHRFTAQSVVQTTTFAAFDSDLCKRPAGTSAYVLSVWTCPYCFFSAYQADFREPLDAKFRDMELRSYPLGEDPGEVDQAEIFVAIKYHNAETFYRTAGRDARFLADLMLRGSYACRSSAVREAPEFEGRREDLIQQSWRRKRRFSVEDMNLAIADRVREVLREGTAKGQVPVYRYLLADALRAAGERLEAVEILEELLGSGELPDLYLENATKKLVLCRKEGEFQEKALSYFQQAEKEGLFPVEEQAVAVYLQAELSRRLGRYETARRLYRRASEIPTEEEWLGPMIERQEGRLPAPPEAERSVGGR